VFKLTNAILVAGFAVAAFAADTNPDMTFVKGASQGGAAEVKLGELAASKGQSPKVKEFGQKMIDDHTKANNDLMSIAQKKNLTVSLDWPPFLRQAVKTQNPSNGELSHGSNTQAVHAGV
jgi:putative membrane protein